VRLWPYGLALTVVVVAFALLTPLAASAATYADTCPSPSDYTTEAGIVGARTCQVLVERADLTETAAEDTRQIAAYTVGVLLVLVAFAPVFWRTFGRVA
jgi:hypothetical protein